MNVALLVLVLGCVLLGFAVLVVRARSIRFARPDTWRRIATAATGALCVSASSIVLLSDEPSTATGAVTEVLTDTISEGEISEDVRVFVDGRDVGVLRITQRSPRARVIVKVDKAGRHAYRTQARIHFEGERPKRTSYASEVFVDGEGTLEVVVDDASRAFVQPAT
jgi:hypothetical protein